MGWAILEYILGVYPKTILGWLEQQFMFYGNVDCWDWDGKANKFTVYLSERATTRTTKMEEILDLNILGQEYTVTQLHTYGKLIF